eukprot:Lankesteria_metandrocarpae@DN2002_c0_g1_i1.p2
MSGYELSHEGLYVANFTGTTIYPASEHWIFKKSWWTEPWPVENHFVENEFSLQALVWGRNHYWGAAIAAVLYMLSIWLGTWYMKKQEPFDLRRPLKYWNLLLAIFSIMGSLRVVPHMINMMSTVGLGNSMCSPAAYTVGFSAPSVWVTLFVYSKYAELLDTAFIVLRKRKVSFLHWFHHATVLVYTWDAFLNEQGVGVYYCSMNYVVHAIMYFYYYLASATSKPPKWGVFVTVLQIVQMFMGVFLTGVGIWNYYGRGSQTLWTLDLALDPRGGGRCFISLNNLLVATFMYATYFYLFAEFFAKRYVLKSGVPKVQVKKDR